MLLRLPVLLPLFALSLLSQPVRALRLYARPSAGYGISPGAGPGVAIDGHPYTGSGILQPGHFIYQQEGASLAEGLYGSLAAGLHVSDHFALELTCNVGIRNRQYATDVTISALAPLQSHVLHYAKSPVLLTPSLVWTPSGNVAKPHIGIGAALPLSRNIYTETHSVQGNSMIYERRKFETDFSAGFGLSAGYSWPVTRRLAVMAEASFLLLSLKVRQANLIECTADGRDLLPSRTVSQRQVDYLDSYYPGAIRPDLPGILPSYRISFSRLGLNAGLTLNLD